jgi:hypothetical protein
LFFLPNLVGAMGLEPTTPILSRWILAKQAKSPSWVLNERRRRAVKMRLDGTSLKDTAAQCKISRTTVIAAVKAFEAGGPAGRGQRRLALLIGSVALVKLEHRQARLKLHPIHSHGAPPGVGASMLRARWLTR